MLRLIIAIVFAPVLVYKTLREDPVFFGIWWGNLLFCLFSPGIVILAILTGLGIIGEPNYESSPGWLMVTFIAVVPSVVYWAIPLVPVLAWITPLIPSPVIPM